MKIVYLQKEKRNYILDCFRILAIMMVLSVHIRGGVSEDIPVIVNTLFGYGAYGVALYFILSGYFSYSSVVKEKSLKEYAIKKSIRILPMYYISLLLTFLIDVFVFGKLPLSIEWLYHIVFLNMFIPSKEWCWWNAVNYFWTMPSFVAWYIISPFIFKYVNKAKTMAILALILSVASPQKKKIMYRFASAQFVDWNFFCLLYVFLLGALAYFIISENKFLLGVLYGLIIGVAGWLCGNHSGFFVFGIFFYFLILVSNLIRISCKNDFIKTIIKNLSDCSYCVYLTHYFVIVFFADKLKLIGNWFIGYAIFIIAAWCVGYITYKMIDRPISKYLISKCELSK